MRQVYCVGEVVRVRATFTYESGQVMPVTGVAFHTRAPGSVAPDAVDAEDITEESTGVHYADVLASEAGVWAVRATCTGPTAAAVEVTFRVAVSAVLA